jgi:Acetyltransferase (GNAT) domain
MGSLNSYKHWIFILSNFYTSKEFISALSSAYFGSSSCELISASCQGKVFRIPKINGNIISKWPFVDFFEADSAMPDNALSAELSAPLNSRLWLPRIAIAEREESWDPLLFTKNFGRLAWPAPFLRWNSFGDFDSYKTAVALKKSNVWKDLERVKRKAASAYGALQFIENDQNISALTQLFEWKSKQYVATGNKDLFSNSKHRQLFLDLKNSGFLRVSSLYYGPRLVAVHAGVVHKLRRYYWMPAHDSDLNALAPGRILLAFLMEHSFNAKEQELDFMIGGEEYKWLYATGFRVIGEGGVPPVRVRFRRFMRDILEKIGAIK